MDGPAPLYSVLVIHICWNALRDDRMEPPIQTEYVRSGGAATVIFIVEGATTVGSLAPRSFEERSLRMPTSHFMMDF
eukprot:7825079-Lingulodinium_polyedra.AAC.1